MSKITIPIQLAIEVSDDDYWDDNDEPKDLIELVAFAGTEKVVLAKTRSFSAYQASQNQAYLAQILLTDLMGG